MSQGVWN